MSKLDWQIALHRQFKAGQKADELVGRLGLRGRIDPLRVAKSEHPFLRWRGDDFGKAYDGKLIYVPSANRFLLLFNTRYDDLPGIHHPRTRFSIAHELGHYFLDDHYEFLKSGGTPHESQSEFRTSIEIEREADSFAASLLLPTQLVAPIVTSGEVTLNMIGALVRDFGVSELSAAFRCIRLSDLPCGVAGIVDGSVAWTFCSERLIDGGCFPGKKTLTSDVARDRWLQFKSDQDVRGEQDGHLRDWFHLFQREDELHDVQVTESFIPIAVLGMLVVVITMDDQDIHGIGDDEDGEFDKLRHDSGD